MFNQNSYLCKVCAKLHVWIHSHDLTWLADPGKARGCSSPLSFINSFINSLVHSVSDPLWKYLYCAATPKWLEIVLSVTKKSILEIFLKFKISKASKLKYDRGAGERGGWQILHSKTGEKFQYSPSCRFGAESDALSNWHLETALGASFLGAY